MSQRVWGSGEGLIHKSMMSLFDSLSPLPPSPPSLSSLPPSPPSLPSLPLLPLSPPSLPSLLPPSLPSLSPLPPSPPSLPSLPPLPPPSLPPPSLPSSMDYLPTSSRVNNLSTSPLNLSPSGSQSPTRQLRSHSALGTAAATPPSNCLHPARRNSLSKRGGLQVSPSHGNVLPLLHPLASSPPIMKRTGSSPQSSSTSSSPMVRASHTPNTFQQLDAAERVRLSLRVREVYMCILLSGFVALRCLFL